VRGRRGDKEMGRLDRGMAILAVVSLGSTGFQPVTRGGSSQTPVALQSPISVQINSLRGMSILLVWS
jgi:hypothetical protein